MNPPDTLPLVLPPESPAPSPSPQMLAGGRGFGVSVETIDDALAIYTEQEQVTLRFWFFLAKDKGWSLSTLARQCGVSSTVLSRLLNGKYNAEVGSVVRTLERAQANFFQVVENPEFIMTSLAKLMFAAFDKTRALKNVTIMWGPKGIGKSTVEVEYTRLNNHGRTYYVRCPGSGCTVYQFVRHVTNGMHVARTKTSLLESRDAVVEYLGKGSRLLIIDELHEIFLTCSDRTIIQICEWLREIADVADCGLALTGTNEMHHQFFTGRHKDVLSQLVDRGTLQIELPAKPTKQDVLLFLDHYHLPAPAEDGDAMPIVNDIIASNGLRKLTHHLRDGQAYAAKKAEAYAWHHFVSAHQAIQSLGKRRK